jgi:hypothetical protein
VFGVLPIIHLLLNGEWHHLMVGMDGTAMTTPDDDDIEDVCRGLLYSATGREEVAQESLPLGAALSTLDAAEAAVFARYVDDYIGNRRAH